MELPHESLFEERTLYPGDEDPPSQLSLSFESIAMKNFLLSNEISITNSLFITKDEG